MLGIASYFDIKTRMVPDVIWLVFGGLGAILYVFDYQTVTSYHVIVMFMGGFAAFMIWRWRLAGIADTFAILAMTVILPVHYEFVMVPIVVVIGGFTIVSIVTVILHIIQKFRRKTSSKQVKPQPFVVYLFVIAILLLFSDIMLIF